MPNVSNKIIEIGKQTYVYCTSRLIFLKVLPHCFDILLFIPINQRLLVYPELRKRAENEFEHLDKIIEKQKFYSSIFEQKEIDIFASIYPTKGKKQAMKEMQKIYRTIQRVNYKNFPTIKMIDYDMRSLSHFLIDNTILRDFVPTPEHIAEANIKYLYLFPQLYEAQEKELAEETLEEIQKKNKDDLYDL